ncbi:hypothetical protein AVEN_220260-1 [Araneus ventricosus]|uniref:Uncharacterized protein n=1 Tax=Araneus ventricosus TaxID=182803 RepID=A0A4Y2U1Q0_ARAVE|nr:hypothetical protein AVEN_220260-1 [Araneus ventricosus]
MDCSGIKKEMLSSQQHLNTIDCSGIVLLKTFHHVFQSIHHRVSSYCILLGIPMKNNKNLQLQTQEYIKNINGKLNQRQDKTRPQAPPALGARSWNHTNHSLSPSQRNSKSNGKRFQIQTPKT